jgi:hypothetical protein
MREKSFIALILVLIIVIFFYDIVFLGKTFSASSLLPGTTPAGPYEFSGHRPQMPFSFDPAGNAWVNEPGPYIIRLLLDKGTLPSWDPYEGLGIPLIGNLNSEVFNPLKLFLNLCPGPFLQDVFFLLRLLVMGLFTYLFLRERKLSPASCFLGSSFFMLSGYSVWWVNLHPLSTVTYLPAVFYFYEKWSEKGDPKNAFLTSLLISFAFTAGKIPDVIIGLSLLYLYALWKGIIKDSLKGLFMEGGKIMAVSISGAFMASAALLPFSELYSHASPLAKAIRTGAASHTIPLITSVSLFQPLFLGWGNYFYGSWLKWTPQVILPHAAVVVMLLTFYAGLTRRTVMKTAPYFLFSLFMFSMIFGILPAHLVSRLPVIGSIEFLKYNAMLYFSLAVISASAFDHLLSEEGNRKKLVFSAGGVSLIVLVYFLLMYGKCPPEMKAYMTTVLLISLSGVIVVGLAFRFLKSRKTFGTIVFAFLLFELFLYMPKDHPDRTESYMKTPYLNLIKEQIPYRLIGDGSSIPPLVSNGMGLYDIRSISVLLPGDYYTFFESLISFSVPQTNNPLTLFSATSPFTDLAGVKYILSREPLNPEKLDDETKTHVKSLRWIRFFDAMIKHTIEGGATYGYFHVAGEDRFSFFFPRKFRFETRLKVTEPFLFAGFAMKDAPKNSAARVRIVVNGRVTEVPIKIEEGWSDQWLDISAYSGKVIDIAVESDGNGDGTIVLGDFGLTPGDEREKVIYEKLLALHNKELVFLKYKGAHEGLHIYQNTNVMDRAFILHKAKAVKGLSETINELQEGLDFRQTGILTEDDRPSVTTSNVGANSDIPHIPVIDLNGEKGKGKDEFPDDKVEIRKYAPDEIAMQVESNGGLLVLSDLYYPGWKVKVNGREDKIVKAFGLLRGVVIGKGRNEVIFCYRPLSLYAGIIISLTTFIVWILILIFRTVKKISWRGNV